MSTSASIASRLETFFQDEPGVISAYLFGSVAEDRAHRESDVDIGVLLDRSRHSRPADRFRERVRLGSALIGVLHRNEIDVVVLNDAPPLLGRRVVTEGRRVFCRDRDIDREYVRVVQSRAADLEPYLKRMRALKLETLRR